MNTTGDSPTSGRAADAFLLNAAPDSRLGKIASTLPPSDALRKPAPERSSNKLPALNITLRAKGVAALAMLVLYVAVVGFYVGQERGKLLEIVQQLEQVYGGQELLGTANRTLMHLIVTLQNTLDYRSVDRAWSEIARDVAAITSYLPKIRNRYPETAFFIDRFQMRFAELDNERSDRMLVVVRNNAQELSAVIATLESASRGQSETLSNNYRDLNRSMTVSVTALNLLGLVVFGIAVTWFFSKLSADIERLEGRAVAVVGGYRGLPLDVTRRDEVGRLMEGVNHMQEELARSERQREISREQHFHQEKMAAVGSLAAAVAHEISNPINSIAGIAQHTIDNVRSHRPLDASTLCTNAELILKQSERIGSIVRQIADLSAPRSPHPELLNLNELVRSTCSFIRYDKRFHRVALVADVDHSLPAVRAVADHLTQVLMNLLINAADAMEYVTDRKPTITVSTRQSDGEVVLCVSDNGHGMSVEILAHAFDESFSTKPAGRGRGIGLYLCKALIEENHGRIELRSTPGEGTVASVHLPVNIG